MTAQRAHLLLGLILLGAAALGWLYATRVPKWNAPDEPAHFNYVRHLATTGGLPVLQPGDYDFRAVEERMAAKFPDYLSVDWLRYESHQPPLYYALAAPIYLATASLTVESQVLALRLFSTLLGLLGLVVAHAVVRQVFPGDATLALAVPGVMAFIPMRAAMYAAVENDAPAELVLSAVLLALVVGLRRRAAGGGLGLRGDVLVGALLAAGLLTKMVAYAALPLVAAAYLAAELVPGQTGEPALDLAARARRLGRRLAVTYGLAALLAGWWLVRNVLVYGWPDLFGLRRHAEVVAGQPQTGSLTADAVRHFALTAFRSFWAQFGWMGILVDERIYTLLLALCGLAALGLALRALGLVRTPAQLAPEQWAALAVLLLALAIVAVGVVAYNLTYLQAQGRYFFPALVPLTLLLVVGLRELMSPEHAGRLLALLSLGLFGLSLLSLYRYVVPAFGG